MFSDKYKKKSNQIKLFERIIPTIYYKMCEKRPPGFLVASDLLFPELKM